MIQNYILLSPLYKQPIFCMMDLKGTLHQLLQSTFSVQSKNAIKEATCALQKLQQEPQFLETLLQIIRDDAIDGMTPDYVDKIRLASVVYTKKLAQTICRKEPEIKVKYLSMIMEVVGSPIPIKLRRNLVANLQFVFKGSPENITKFNFFALLTQRMQIQLQTPEVDIVRYQTLAMWGQLLFVLRFDNVTQRIVEDLIQPMLGLFAKACELTSRLLSTDQYNPVLVLQYLETVFEYSSLFKMCLRTEELPRCPVFTKLLQNKLLVGTITTILTLQSPQSVLRNTIIQVGESKQCQQLNTIKTNIICCVEILLRFAYYYLKKGLIQSNLFLVTAHSYLQGFLATCLLVLSRARPSQLAGTFILKCIHQILGCVSVAVEIPENYDMFSSRREDWLNGFIFCFFQVSKNLKKQFIQQPQSFVDYMYQMMNRSSDMFSASNRQPEENVIHIVVAKLLVRFCIYIDGMLLDVFNSSLLALNTSDSAEEQKLKALVILGVISVKATERNDLVNRLYEYFQIEMATNPSDESLDSKIKCCLQFLVISKYMYSFKKFDREFERNVLGLSLQMLKGEYAPAKKNPSLSIMNLSLLEQLFKLSGDQTQKMAVEVLGCLIQFINSSDATRHLFQAIYIILKDYKSVYKQLKLLSVCAHQLTVRLLNQQSNEEKKISQLCWKSLRALPSSRECSVELAATIEGDLHKLHPFFGLQKFNFTEDFINTEIKMIRLQKYILPSQMALTVYVPKIIKRSQGYMQEVFVLLNLLIYYGASHFTVGSDAFQSVLTTCVGLIETSQGNRMDEGQHAKRFLLLQTLMAKYPLSFKKQMVQSILQHLLYRLDHTESIKLCFYQQNLACTMALALALSVDYAQDLPKAEQYIMKVLFQARKIEKEYPRKVYSVALSTIINKYKVGSPFQKHILHLFHMAVTLLADTKQLVQTQMCSQEESEQMGQEDQETQYVRAVQKLLSPIVQQDNFQYFRTCFNSFKSKHPQLWGSMCSQYQANTLDRLKTIMRVKMTESGPREIFRIKK